ncbi:MAG: WbuC family cupin fold metalloprotein [Deltaproteobacteria bacterium]|nr:WbuC family cupin fold metalloprotein [Deltaproteobacteria bacterium]
MLLLNQSLFRQLAAQAAAHPRLRQHLNLHRSYEDPCQRLLIAMQPDSYIRPHRHRTDPKPECFIALRGRFALLIFDNHGEIVDRFFLGSGEDAAGADLPVGIWHSVVCLEPDSVFFETKPGPFHPDQKKDPAPWAPEEGSPEAAAYLQTLLSQVLKQI